MILERCATLVNHDALAGEGAGEGEGDGNGEARGEGLGDVARLLADVCRSGVRCPRWPAAVGATIALALLLALAGLVVVGL